MDDFMANLFGFPPGSRMFVNDQLAFDKAVLTDKDDIKREGGDTTMEPAVQVHSISFRQN